MVAGLRWCIAGALNLRKNDNGSISVVIRHDHVSETTYTLTPDAARLMRDVLNDMLSDLTPETP